jgi:hypothetical protein
VPNIENILARCSTVVYAKNSGYPKNISAITHPADQISDFIL